MHTNLLGHCNQRHNFTVLVMRKKIGSPLLHDELHRGGKVISQHDEHAQRQNDFCADRRQAFGKLAKHRKPSQHKNRKHHHVIARFRREHERRRDRAPQRDYPQRVLAQQQQRRRDEQQRREFTEWPQLLPKNRRRQLILYHMLEICMRAVEGVGQQSHCFGLISAAENFKPMDSWIQRDEQHAYHENDSNADREKFAVRAENNSPHADEHPRKRDDPKRGPHDRSEE